MLLVDVDAYYSHRLLQFATGRDYQPFRNDKSLALKAQYLDGIALLQQGSKIQVTQREIHRFYCCMFISRTVARCLLCGVPAYCIIINSKCCFASCRTKRELRHSHCCHFAHFFRCRVSRMEQSSTKWTRTFPHARATSVFTDKRVSTCSQPASRGSARRNHQRRHRLLSDSRSTLSHMVRSLP